MDRVRDHRTPGLRDYGTTGLRDYGTAGLRDYGTTGLKAQSAKREARGAERFPLTAWRFAVFSLPSPIFPVLSSITRQEALREESGFSATPAAQGFLINSPSNVASIKPCRLAKVTTWASVVSLDGVSGEAAPSTSSGRKR